MDDRQIQIEMIMREEREGSIRSLIASSLPRSAIEDAARLCGLVRETVNQMVADLDRPIHEDVAPLALRTMADELERTMRRFRDAGLAARRAS